MPASAGSLSSASRPRRPEAKELIITFNFSLQFEKEDNPLIKSKARALAAAKIAMEKKAVDVLVLDLKGLSVIADFFIICSGESTTQVRAIAEAIEENFSKKSMRPIGIEGLNYSHWVLMDYGDIIIHVFEEETRAYYQLEKLWLDAPRIPYGS